MCACTVASSKNVQLGMLCTKDAKLFTLLSVQLKVVSHNGNQHQHISIFFANYHKINLHSYSAIDKEEAERTALPLIPFNGTSHVYFYTLGIFAFGFFLHWFNTILSYIHTYICIARLRTVVARLQNHINFDQSKPILYLSKCTALNIGLRWWVPRKWSYAGM